MNNVSKRGGQMSKLWSILFRRKRNLLILALMIAMPLTVPLVSAQENNVQPAQTATTDKGLQYIAAALAIGLSALGAGAAIYGATTAGAAAIAEKPELATWVLIYAALGEGLAIYGLVISIMIISA
jgi:V/A-type H+-transporting ATPase subunit K